MTLTDADLIGSGQSVHLELVNNCYLTNSRIGNYDIGLEIWGATDFVMNGGNIHDNRVGIFLQDDIVDDAQFALTNTTVDLIGKATLENNLMGIFGVAGAYTPDEGPYPMITLDCARLIENVIGIRGRDLLLNMDGGSELAPNILIENPNFSKSKILELCYYKLDLAGTPIGATNNYWGESPPSIFRYIVQTDNQNPLANVCKMEVIDGYEQFNSINVGSGNVALDFSDYLDIEPTGCGSPGEPTGTGGNDDKVYTPLKPTDAYQRKIAECLAPNEREIYEDYWQAYATYLSEIEKSTADHSASRDAFSPIAKLGEDKKAKYSGFCRMLIEKARSRAGYNIYRNSASRYRKVYNIDGASVYPNPTEHLLYVKTEKNIFSNYQIVDVMGSEWQNGSIDVDAVETKIEVSQLPPGVYIIYLQSETNRWKSIRFVVSE